MYDLHKEKCKINMVEPKKLKYYNIFNTKFSLHFKTSQQDTCKTCDELNLKIEATENEENKRNIQVQLELHQRKADAARDAMKIDSNRVEEAYIFTLHLQKALSWNPLFQ